MLCTGDKNRTPGMRRGYRPSRGRSPAGQERKAYGTNPLRQTPIPPLLLPRPTPRGHGTYFYVMRLRRCRDFQDSHNTLCTMAVGTGLQSMEEYRQNDTLHLEIFRCAVSGQLDIPSLFPPELSLGFPPERRLGQVSAPPPPYPRGSV